jgi:SAM-dependent methyltransferase
MLNLRQLFFDLQYRLSKPRWDSGVTPPEVVALIEGGSIQGRALDLGCGTGTNTIYLAQHGLSVVGIDFSPKAIATARDKARRAGITVDLHVADVTRLDSLGVREPFDFVLDLGCFHAVDAEGRARYAQHLARLTRPGSVFMLYAFSPRPPDQSGPLIQIRNVGATPEQVQQTFAPHFALTRIERGADRGDRASAWYWFKRQ